MDVGLVSKKLPEYLRNPPPLIKFIVERRILTPEKTMKSVRGKNKGSKSIKNKREICQGQERE